MNFRNIITRKFAIEGNMAKKINDWKKTAPNTLKIDWAAVEKELGFALHDSLKGDGVSGAPKFNTQDPEAVEIRRKAAAVGAELYDVTTLEAVRAFEAEAGVKLPEDYVWFITNVGNGGTWNNTGIFEYEFYPLTTVDDAWFAYYAEGYGFPNGKKEKYALGVLDEGDAYCLGIILTGEHYGEISDIADYYYAYFNGDKSVRNFKELYTAWLDDAYNGYDDDAFDRRLRGTIEELFDRYIDGREDECLWSICLKVNKKAASREFINRVHNEFLRETDNSKQVRLCDILMKSGFDDPYSVINRIFRPENYERIIQYLGDSYLSYFKDRVRSDEVMDGAEVYYPILVEILKHFTTLPELPFEDFSFKKCLNMTVMNPKFNENDIIEFLNSNDELTIKRLSRVYEDTVKSRIGRYVDAAREKKARLRKNREEA